MTLTDTLDEGLIYQDAHWGGNQPFENDPFPEPTMNENQLVWDLGSLAPAEVNGSISRSIFLIPWIDGELVTNCIDNQRGGR